MEMSNVRQRGRRGLVDDAHHFETGDLTGVLGRLPLRVVEVGRHGDDRLGHPLSEIGFGVGLELLEDHRRDLLRRVILVPHLDAHVAVRGSAQLIGHEPLVALHRRIFVLAAHEALDRVDRVVGVGDRLTLGDLADHPLAALGIDRDDGGREAATFRVRDDRRLARLHHGDHRVRGAEVDTDYLGHVCLQ